MYPYVLGLHNIVRWLVLLAGVTTVILVWRGWLGRRQWTSAEAKATRAFVGFVDFQFLIGLSLFFVFNEEVPYGRIGHGRADIAKRLFRERAEHEEQ